MVHVTTVHVHVKIWLMVLRFVMSNDEM